ncbi:MAG: hypothetical protein LBC64_07380 [Fibromonadaceae bacterium]|jgi:hypothetical protein|nr:hypothetical protein [Fibromonadaceae bacterium]
MNQFIVAQSGKIINLSSVKLITDSPEKSCISAFIDLGQDSSVELYSSQNAELRDYILDRITYSIKNTRVIINIPEFIKDAEDAPDVYLTKHYKHQDVPQ